MFNTQNTTPRELYKALDGTHPDVLKNIIPCIATSSRIAAIKEIRSYSGLELMAALEITDRLFEFNIDSLQKTYNNLRETNPEYFL